MASSATRPCLRRSDSDGSEFDIGSSFAQDIDAPTSAQRSPPSSSPSPASNVDTPDTEFAVAVGGPGLHVVSSPLRLSHSSADPDDANVDTLSLGAIVGDADVLACWNFNYQFEVDYLMYAPCPFLCTVSWLTVCVGSSSTLVFAARFKSSWYTDGMTESTLFPQRFVYVPSAILLLANANLA